MQRTSSFLNYRRRIRRVLDHMIVSAGARMRGESNERLDLSNLADIACWSSEHLVRAWSGIFGQPPLATARRIQLDCAAQALRRGEPIMRVASHAGYGSGQAFAHAFQRQFNMCASQFIRLPAPQAPSPMRIVHLNEPLLCMAAPFSGVARESAQTFDEMLNVLARSGSDRREWDVFSIVPSGSYTIDLDQHVSFHAAVLTNPIRTPIRGLDSVEIAAGTYAVFDRPFDGLTECPDAMLRNNGWRRTDAPRFHQFITDPARTIPSQRRDRRWIPVVAAD